jgi:hypothetical protein
MVNGVDCDLGDRGTDFAPYCARCVDCAQVAGKWGALHPFYVAQRQIRHAGAPRRWALLALQTRVLLFEIKSDDPAQGHPTMNDASQSEMELLRRLHRGAMVSLSALKQLQERTPEDELRLRQLMRLEGRLSERIQWVEAQSNDPSQAKRPRDALHSRTASMPTGAIGVPV